MEGLVSLDSVCYRKTKAYMYIHVHVASALLPNSGKASL